MKKKTADSDDGRILVPNKVLAEALDTSPYHVIKMRQEGLVPKGVGRGKFPLIESCRMVVRRLREERKTASSIDGTSGPKEQALLARDKRFDLALDRAERMGEVVKVETENEVFETLGVFFRSEFMNVVKSAVDEYEGDRDEVERVFEPWARRLLGRICDRIEDLGREFPAADGAGRPAAPRKNGGRLGRRK